MKLVLPSPLGDDIAGFAKAALPGECCGLIEGVAEKEGFRAVRLHPAHNLADKTDRFEINPAGHTAAARAARMRGHGIIGCYHSHPHGSAEPSSTDLAGADQENFLWLIAAPDDLRAFVYSRGRFAAVGLATGADLVTSSL
jgi:desampylase